MLLTVLTTAKPTSVCHFLLQYCIRDLPLSLWLTICSAPLGATLAVRPRLVIFIG
jgi:hypothetical protein